MPFVERARETLLYLELIDFKIEFRKVRAHVGEIGNEKADQLVKEAAVSQDLDLSYSALPRIYVDTILGGKSSRSGVECGRCLLRGESFIREFVTEGFG